ncbi:Crotonobetainyl-CoA:carnitine CoA-transferase CaiB [Paracoccus isoporae]|uniref:Crotonobetainyl-CoA:carnitine CoA-transferase CaiB n=1 Tax=Paracoccus isoporae TaxID=591205 RepID=A0A1G7CNR9_9RHOB|nr:CoA transferase [Paracoccus isoporae]SDE40861.1 Crotonobetainyl-CoA:carnitine CoA-transferase CaiB [Paracoccus isoporae]
MTDKPLSGLRVIERANGVAAAQAGRLMCQMGAEVVMAEPSTGSPLREEHPLLPDGQSALFIYLSLGKRSVVCDPATPDFRRNMHKLLAGADILIDDTPVAERAGLGLDEATIAGDHPHIVHLSVLPFGAFGPKAHWKGDEINLIHAGGEGFLLPNGLTADLFPDRPPLKIAGHFAEMQGGTTAAMAALAALWTGQGQFVDASVQDANVAVGAFAVQRFGDGSVEHRLTRSFKFGGVIECADGYVELLTLENRQWQGLIELLGAKDWARDPHLKDEVGRSARGAEINRRIRDWARTRKVEEMVARAQTLGVPMARYNAPEQVLSGTQETARGIFATIDTPDGPVKVQALPFRFGPDPLPVSDTLPGIGADQSILSCPAGRRATA